MQKGVCRQEGLIGIGERGGSKLPSQDTRAAETNGEEKEVVVERFQPFYIGLFLAIALIILFPILLTPLCGPIAIPHGECAPALAASLAAAIATIIAHEATHYTVARLLHVPGAKMRAEWKMLALMLDYNYMTPKQYLVVTLAPQALTILLLAIAPLLQGTPRLAACIAAGANLAGGAPDIVNSLYFTMVHGKAQKFHLLYNEKGAVEGGIVEYRDKLILYLFHTHPGRKDNKKTPRQQNPYTQGKQGAGP